MEKLSRLQILAATAGGGVVAASTQALAATFGNPDEPPQGAINTKDNPASAADPGPNQ
jgi:oxalate decarboxylase